MKPRLKPQKGWRYRIIVCDRWGNVVYDDFNMEAACRDIAIMLMEEIVRKGDC